MTYNGWLALDKPYGMSSAHAVNRVKRLLNVKKAGHAGTLDPLATGILPIAIGEATKTVAFSMAAEKEYQFTVQFGEARDTDDTEGEVIETSSHRPTQASIEAALPDFIGMVEQTPPLYSAIKQQGKRACDLAREGQEVTLKSRIVSIEDITLCSVDNTDRCNEATFTMICGKGVYIRSFGRDLAHKLKTVGHIKTLRRLKVGKFCEKNAISLDCLDDMRHTTRLSQLILPVDTGLDDIPAVIVSPEISGRIRHGQRVFLPELSELNISSDDNVLIKTGDEPVALGCVDGMILKPVRVFN